MPQPKNKKLTFRPDINALRAVAVLGVLFYHFQVPGFSGGFIGVDVFFVISGFLMSQIIYGQLSENRFSLAAFYEARIRRIVPALVMLGIVLLLSGYFYLIPFDYTILGKRVLTSLTFVSNIALLHKAPYFDPASREQWLLHTWSLSVEAQFYLFWPFFLIALQKNKKILKPCIAAVFALSLMWCVLKTQKEASAAFYSLPTRVWEFTAGSFLYFFKQNIRPIKNLSFAGLALILISAVFYSGDLAYPGYWAFVPVAGAALFMTEQSTRAFITNRVTQFFGDISYSLYLWHWPVVVGAKYFDIALTPLHQCCLISLSVLLAYASFELVEKPSRYRIDWKISTGAGAVVALAAYLVFAFQGMPSHVPDNVMAAQSALQDSNPRRIECMYSGKKNAKLPECRLGASVDPTVAIWGDSHADAVFPVLDKALAEDKRSAFFYSYSGCPPILDAIITSQVSLRRDESCKIFNDLTLNKIIAAPEVRDVIMISRWSFYLNGGLDDDSLYRSRVVFDKAAGTPAFDSQTDPAAYTSHMLQTMCTLTQHKKNVYVVMPIPEMEHSVPVTLAKSRLLWHKDAQIEISIKDYETKHAAILKALGKAQQQCHVHVLDPKAGLCNQSVCSALKDGKPLYRDDSHLSNTGSLVLEPMFERALR